MHCALRVFGFNKWLSWLLLLRVEHHSLAYNLIVCCTIYNKQTFSSPEHIVIHKHIKFGGFFYVFLLISCFFLYFFHFFLYGSSALLLALHTIWILLNAIIMIEWLLLVQIDMINELNKNSEDSSKTFRCLSEKLFRLIFRKVAFFAVFCCERFSFFFIAFVSIQVYFVVAMHVHCSCS